jgi:hypothetical protein
MLLLEVSTTVLDTTPGGASSHISHISRQMEASIDDYIGELAVGSHQVDI